MAHVTGRTVPRLGAAGLVVALGALAACGSGGSGGSGGSLKTGPGIDIKNKTITLGVLSPLSGPVKVIGEPLTRGQEVYFDHLNDAGGINGYKVKLVEKDDLYNPQTHVQEYNDILPQVAFIAQSLGSPTTLAIQQLADSGKVLLGAATQSSSWVTDPVMAVIGTPYAVDIANGIHYIVKTKGDASAPIGIIYQNDEYGQDGLRGYKAAMDSYHFTDAGQASYNVGDKDYTAEVLKMKSGGAKYVFVTAVPSAAATIVGTAAAMHYNPTFVFQGPAWSEYLMTADGSATGKPTAVEQALAANTWVLGFEAAWGDTTVPGMAQFLADTQKYASSPPQNPDGYFMYGYCMAQMEAAVLKKALDNNDLSRPGILNAKLNLGTVDFGGLIPSVDYTPNLGPVSRETNISQVDIASPGFLKVIQPYFIGDAAKALKFPAS